MSFKKLVLVRHAKSSWNEPHVDDHDRQLNQRGLKNAPEMGLRLKKQGFSPDYVETSTGPSGIFYSENILSGNQFYP